MRNTDKKKQKENDIFMKGYNKMENAKCRTKNQKNRTLKSKKVKCKS